MPAPRQGAVVNGYIYLGGDPNSPTSWREASVGETTADKARGTQIGKAEGVFTGDRRNQFDAAQGMQEQANTAYNVLAKTNTGPLAGAELFVNRLGIPLISNREKAQNLGALERMGSEGALTLADGMKGALSDKDIAFLKSMTYNLGKSGAENVDVARAQEWASQKARSYLKSRSRWERELGSIDARNPKGQNFDDAWADYSARVYPRPQVGMKGRYRPNTGGNAVPAKTASGASVSDW